MRIGEKIINTLALADNVVWSMETKKELKLWRLGLKIKTKLVSFGNFENEDEAITKLDSE